MIVRYGFRPLGDTGYCQYVEHLFRRMPDVDTLREVVNNYNAENGINEEFVAADYGFHD